MKRLFVILFVLASSLSFAEWIDAQKDCDVTLEELNKQFFIPANKSKKGIHISAADLSNLCSFVELRYFEGYVDYKIELSENVIDKNCILSLDLLDEDKFLLKTIETYKISKGFSGSVCGKFSIGTVSKFEEVKYYDLYIRRVK